ncbi:MAG: ammonium transporter [Verrucomicrobiota bacterium]|nr:ammonium transporter [Verrucomicrobiota bacterium]
MIQPEIEPPNTEPFFMKRIACILSLLAGFCLISFPVLAQEAEAASGASAPAAEAAAPAEETANEPDVLNGANTAWILTATALVLFMTIPGLSLFYAGLVGRKNVLSVLMHCFMITAIMSVLWVVCGYSIAFGGASPYFGGLEKIFASGVTQDTLGGLGKSEAIPEFLFFGFQMTFFIITPALMVGAFVERMKFSAMILFTSLWALLVYAPVCHWVWGGNGFMLNWDDPVKDLAGGIVVHITAGIGALIACILVGPRKGYPTAQFQPHNLPLCVIGTGMLWVGWFGFNAGSQLAANGDAALTLVVTHISAATATIVWSICEKVKHGKASMLGAVTGSIAGLAAITPASGDVGPMGALAIGAASGLLCWYASVILKAKLGYDDSLDVVGVHGVGGLVGTLLVAFFASEALGGKTVGDYSMVTQFIVQLKASVITIIYTAIVSVIILLAVKAICGGSLRVSESDEQEGLDLTAHGESGYNN